jgi:hypothetical protein
MVSANNARLRGRLTEMTESRTEPSTHEAQLAVISEEFPNTIKPLKFQLPEDRYTCGMYVFDFSEDPDYLEIAGFGLPHVYAGPTFFEWLLAGQLLEEVDEQCAHDEDLIMYFENGQWKHVGFWRLNDRVESKWGLGLLYHHGRWEVPDCYGDQVRFFRSVSPEAAIEHFIRYAQSRGAPVELAE